MNNHNYVSTLHYIEPLQQWGKIKLWAEECSR